MDFKTKYIEVINLSIISENITKLEILFNETLISIIGLYTAYNNNTTFNMYKQNEIFFLVDDIIDKNQALSINSIVIGNMSFGAYSEKKFDKTFKNL